MYNVHHSSAIGFSINLNKIQNLNISFTISCYMEYDIECDTVNERSFLICYGIFAAVVQISDQTKFSIFAHIYTQVAVQNKNRFVNRKKNDLIEFLSHLTTDVDRCPCRCILFIRTRTRTHSETLSFISFLSFACSPSAQRNYMKFLSLFTQSNIEHLHLSSWKSHLNHLVWIFFEEIPAIAKPNWIGKISNLFHFTKIFFFFVLSSMNYSYFVSSNFKIMTIG